MSCSCAVFVWLGFRVLSTVLKMDLRLHCLKTCQTFNCFVVQGLFCVLNCGFFKKEKRKKNQGKKNQKEAFIYMCVCVSSLTKVTKWKMATCCDPQLDDFLIV